MKNKYKIILVLILGIIMFSTINVYAEIDTSSIKDDSKNSITDYSISNIVSTGDIVKDTKKLGFSVLTLIKYIISGGLVLVLVYVGIQMIMSMGNNEEDLSAAKKQIRYTLIALIFINIPGSLYSIINKNKTVTKNDGSTDSLSLDGNLNNTWGDDSKTSVLIDSGILDDILGYGILVFVEVAISAIAIIIIIISGIKIMTSRGREEQITESKNKIAWSLIGLMFIGFIEVWKNVVFTGDIKDGAKLFSTLEKLGLYFAGPIAIAFLTLAGYYYITANGEEERVNKAKSIIINTLIATVILLASHAFLKDLLSLNV